MKQFLLMLTAGIVGALVTVAVIRQAPIPGLSSHVETYAKTASTASPTVYTPPSGSPGMIDLTTAAAKAMPVVVTIEAKESTASAEHRRDEERKNDPWSRFFDFNNDFSFPFGLQPREGAGSGVIISPDGYIVTNNHVVDFADQITVKTLDKQYDAKVIGRDPSTDLAVLKIDAKNLPTLENGNSDNLKVGEWVLAVGNPFEYLTSTVTAGIVSAKGRDLNIIRGDRTIEEFIQTDAAINPGNSGGALVDAEGRLVGINAAIASPTGSYSGYSFAIPINLVVRITDDIIANGGNIERTNLGVMVEELDKNYADQMGISIDKGLVVKEVVDGGAAQYAGILPNDIIVKVDDKDINKFDDIQNVMNFAKVGDTLNVTVYRKGEYLELPVRLRKKI